MVGDAVPLRGVRGRIQWQHYPAADVVDFTVLYVRDRAAWTLRGGVMGSNPFNLKQTPLVFAAPVAGGRVLRWPVLTVAIADGKIAATLGAPEHEPLRPT